MILPSNSLLYKEKAQHCNQQPQDLFLFATNPILKSAGGQTLTASSNHQDIPIKNSFAYVEQEQLISQIASISMLNRGPQMNSDTLSVASVYFLSTSMTIKTRLEKGSNSKDNILL